MLIKRKSFATGVVREIDIDVSAEQMADFEGGSLVENAFPQLSADDREFILTGITADEWKDLFNGDDE